MERQGRSCRRESNRSEPGVITESPLLTWVRKRAETRQKERTTWAWRSHWIRLGAQWELGFRLCQPIAAFLVLGRRLRSGAGWRHDGRCGRRGGGRGRRSCRRGWFNRRRNRGLRPVFVGRIRRGKRGSSVGCRGRRGRRRGRSGFDGVLQGRRGPVFVRRRRRRNFRLRYGRQRRPSCAGQDAGLIRRRRIRRCFHG